MKIVKNDKELLLAIHIAAFLLALPWTMRRRDIREVVRRVTPVATRRKQDSLAVDRIICLCEQTMRLFQRGGYTYTCLRRCIVMYHFLRSHGTPVAINFGAMWAGENLTGHSWLSLGGDILFDRPENVVRFVHFFSLPVDEKAVVPSNGKEKEYLDTIHFD